MSIQLEKSIWIDRPISEFFAFVTDANNLTVFVPGIVEAAKVTDGPKGTGT